MGKISGWVEAKCAKCACRFSWYLNEDRPFVDAIFIGTCDNCLWKKDHECVDEYVTNVHKHLEKDLRKPKKKMDINWRQ